MDELLRTLLLLAAVAMATFLSALPARAADRAPSNLDLDLQYRYEFVDQDDFDEDARASTLRTRLVYRSADHTNFRFLIEIDDIRSIGNDLYNSTRNGNTDRPVVADPKGIQINQALVTYSGIENTLIRAGRRRITLDNHRFIGDVGWRQNDQTYDGFSLTNSSLPNISIEYAYVDNVNRIFGPDSGTPAADLYSDSHVLNAKFKWLSDWNITAYAYFLDLENSPRASNKTIGFRVNGGHAVSDRTSTSYVLDIAHQNDYGDNPNSYSSDYFLLEAALTTDGITGKLSYEVLEGNPVQAFQTPLATLHAFQGWSDKFLATPADGIKDLYFSMAVELRGANVALIYHQFDPEAGGPRYGSEWNLLIRKPFAKRYSIIFKYADYKARNFSTDARKLWVMFTAGFNN